MQTIQEQCQKAAEAQSALVNLSTNIKNTLLKKIAAAMEKEAKTILIENKIDLANGKKAKMSKALLDRLKLDQHRLKGIQESLLIMEKLPDPTNEIISGWTQPNGLEIIKKRVPMGVIGIIYEARPNVTADAIGLCIKTGNALVLRGSTSAYNSNKAITEVAKKVLKQENINPECIQLLEDTSHKSVKDLVKQKDYLDLIIPRGGALLIQNVVNSATVPTIETGVGNCHVFVDESADLKQALAIIINAKTQRPSVCNACETVLIHKNLAAQFLPKLARQLKANNVVIRGCKNTKALVNDIELATEADWQKEYLDLILAIRIVKNVSAAVEHIRKYGTQHSEAILTQSMEAMNYFEKMVDAAAVLVNTSTRFVDGGEFGFGAEIGISTQKLHARGPMGLKELTTYKYIVKGAGQIRC